MEPQKRPEKTTRGLKRAAITLSMIGARRLGARILGSGLGFKVGGRDLHFRSYVL